ncbi:MAG: Asp-tRNA(Asn)/Glu-tRNA(Gln) amidotransferase subunit GatB [Anaerolineales bacterium]|nr:Asp-tRNA(Asn)/Glu-tRNA(Gln) amidotransferase subunit GatB [Anaerolineales bacterium]
MNYEPVIGLETHAELLTNSKMFCGCAVMDSTAAPPNTLVCEICAGLPGTLPVLNERAVEYALRVALALNCTVPPVSVFARKNYFYPDLPKGYQISQYELPLAVNGWLEIETTAGLRRVRIRRVHLEEDTGKLFHVATSSLPLGEGAGVGAISTEHSLVDLNRAGVPLLEIVSEPDLRSAEEVKAYAIALRAILRYLGVNSGDMEKGILRFEPNISVRPAGSTELRTRTELKNLNSFRALERAVAYEIERQIGVWESGGEVVQETRGWDEAVGETVGQRGKEHAHDYRYFPEPDLPPLVITPEWIERVRAALPELPAAKRARFQAQYGLSAYDAALLTEERAVADFFEAAVANLKSHNPKSIANWMTGELFRLMNANGQSIEQVKVSPESLAALVELVASGTINANTAKAVFAEMFATGHAPDAIVAEQGLAQVSDQTAIERAVAEVLAGNPEQVATYLGGKATVEQWFFGQTMKSLKGQGDPQIIRRVLAKKLEELRLKTDD